MTEGAASSAARPQSSAARRPSASSISASVTISGGSRRMVCRAGGVHQQTLLGDRAQDELRGAAAGEVEADHEACAAHLGHAGQAAMPSRRRAPRRSVDALERRVHEDVERGVRRGRDDRRARRRWSRDRRAGVRSRELGPAMNAPIGKPPPRALAW